MNWFFDFLDRMRAAYRARRVAKANADLQSGSEILAKAQAEAAEMASAATPIVVADTLTPPSPPKHPAPAPGENS